MHGNFAPCYIELIMSIINQLILLGCLSYSLVTTFAVGAYCMWFDDMKYHWTWSVNGKLLIPYSISGVIGYVVSFWIIYNSI